MGFIQKVKKGDIQYSELAKLILAVAFLALIIYLIVSYVKPEFGVQQTNIKDAFSGFK